MVKMTDLEIEREIERLKKDEDVKLSKLNERVKYRKRQQLYTLRWHQRQGKELREAGITEEMIRAEDY
ncbi:MAG: hypothetical protein DBY26_06770 [Amedibacillus dolichus]|nr:MAG: hypothetical protein DBY26_06770 [Amedibacillus dolichus]